MTRTVLLDLSRCLQTTSDSDPIPNVTRSVADLLAELGFEDVESQAETATLDPATANAAAVLSALEELKRTYTRISDKLGESSLRIIQSIGLYGIKRDDVTFLWTSGLGSAQANLAEFRENLQVRTVSRSSGEATVVNNLRG